VKKYKYEIALSFAGQDREYVSKVAELLKNSGIRVFYDEFEQVDLWGKDLYSHLYDVYQNQAQYTVMFVSKHYAANLWTNHERKSAQARAFEDSKEYILPARFDETDIPGIFPTVGYIDLKKLLPEQFFNLIVEKLNLKKSFWDFSASKAQDYLSTHHIEAHRGAILWCPNVSAIFENRGCDLETPYGAQLLEKLSELNVKIIGKNLDIEHGDWCLLVNNSDTKELFDLVWVCFGNHHKDVNFGTTSLFKHEQKNAWNRLWTYWDSPHKKTCED
jgi:hypothetical protein